MLSPWSWSADRLVPLDRNTLCISLYLKKKNWQLMAGFVESGSHLSYSWYLPSGVLSSSSSLPDNPSAPTWFPLALPLVLPFVPLLWLRSRLDEDFWISSNSSKYASKSWLFLPVLSPGWSILYIQHCNCPRGCSWQVWLLLQVLLLFKVSRTCC